MTCEKCKHLTEKIEIRVPADLKRALVLAKENVASGVLKEITHFDDGRIIFHDTPFKELSTEGPWPDVFSYYFVCALCNSAYEVSAETYHGSGGSWQSSIGPR